MNNKLSKVALVGRMNVGKSTLFNRLSTQVRSMALNYQGVTRDYLKDQVEWKGVFFQLFDTGGIENFKKTDDIIQQKVQQKVINLLKEVDVIIFIVDGTVGLLPHDRWIAQELHKISKPVLVAINKCDNKLIQEHGHEFYALGFKQVFQISAEHGTGINDLLDNVISLIPKKSQDIETDSDSKCKVVFLGKPNVGKSSLLNSILNEDRAIVSEQAGTTREALSETIKFYQEDIQITDTPGIRRKRSVSGELEPLMVKSSFAALKDSDIVVLLMDGSAGEIVDQELKLAFYAYTEQYKALILLVNKEDLMTDHNRTELNSSFEYYDKLIKKVPLLYISCKSGKNIGKILPLIDKVYKRYTQTFDGQELKTLFVKELHERPLFRAKQKLMVYEVEQIKTAPITIALKVNLPVFFEDSQKAYFENIMRAHYDLLGVPVKFVIRSTKDKLEKVVINSEEDQE